LGRRFGAALFRASAVNHAEKICQSSFQMRQNGEVPARCLRRRGPENSLDKLTSKRYNTKLYLNVKMCKRWKLL